MKKILFGTTALLAAGAFVADAQASEPVKLQLGGYYEYFVVGAKQDSDWGSIASNRANNFDVQGEGEIYFKGSTTLDNGATIGVMVQLEAGTDNNTDGNNTNDVVDESYMYVSGKYGKLMLGSVDNAAYLMRAAAPNASYMEVDDTNTSYLLKPGAVNDIITDVGFDGDGNKITYMTPKFYGLQGGITYTPSNASSGDDSLAKSERIEKAADADDYWAFGLTYDRTIGDVGLLLSAGYTIADINTTNTRKTNMEDFSGGINLTYAGWTVGGSVRRVLQSFSMDTTSSQGWAWDAGVMYAEGPYAVSLSYRSSSTEGSRTDADEDTVSMIALGGKYALGPGVDLFAQLATADYSDEGSVKSDSNTAYGGLVGIHLDF